MIFSLLNSIVIKTKSADVILKIELTEDLVTQSLDSFIKSVIVLLDEKKAWSSFCPNHEQ